MKLQLLLLLLISFLFLATFSSGFSQSSNLAGNDFYFGLKEDLDSLMLRVGEKKIVALGEGTHGTKEFNEVRSLLSKKLIEEKGFNYIVFESSYGGAFYLNEQMLNNPHNLDKEITQNLISIWHTKEIKNFLEWVSLFNKKSSSRVSIGGIDYAELRESLELVKKGLSEYEILDKDKILKELEVYVLNQDELWNNLNKEKFKINRKKWLTDGKKAYKLILNLESEIIEKKILNSTLNSSLLNLKLGFETVHLFTTKRKDASRDSCMAEMVKNIVKIDPTAKVIVWAHNVHIANKPVFNDQNGGGMGSFLIKNYPDEYFSIATLTSIGSFSATKDPVPTRFNRFISVDLESPIEGSLEQRLGNENKMINTKIDSDLPEKIKMRFIGFGPQSGAATFVETAPKQLFDVIIFLVKTNATERLVE